MTQKKFCFFMFLKSINIKVMKRNKEKNSVREDYSDSEQRILPLVTSTHSMEFRSAQIGFDENADIISLLESLRLAFDIRAVEKNSDYSSGSTYFIRALEDPRCQLEELALSIFKHVSQ